MAAATEISDSIKVTPFYDAVAALAHLNTTPAFPDVIFLDLNMPMMNGQQFLEQIQQHPDWKKIPVIIFSTTANIQTINKLKAKGASDFITKPGLFNELVSILKPLLT